MCERHILPGRPDGRRKIEFPRFMCVCRAEPPDIPFHEGLCPLPGRTSATSGMKRRTIMNRENLFRCVREFSRSAHAEKFVVAAAKAHPSDLAEALELLEPEKTLALLSTLDARVAAGLFAYFSRERRKELLTALSGEKLAELFEHMASDDRVDIFVKMDGEAKRRLLSCLTGGGAGESSPTVCLSGRYGRGGCNVRVCGPAAGDGRCGGSGLCSERGFRQGDDIYAVCCRSEGSPVRHGLSAGFAHGRRRCVCGLNHVSQSGIRRSRLDGNPGGRTHPAL